MVFEKRTEVIVSRFQDFAQRVLVRRGQEAQERKEMVSASGTDENREIFVELF